MNREDYSWLSEWAGGIVGLVEKLGSTDDEMHIALECLDLVADTDPQGLAELLASDQACNILQTMDTVAARSMLGKVYMADRTQSPLTLPDEKTRLHAWAHFHSDPSLLVHLLVPTTAELLAVSPGQSTSNIDRLLNLASQISTKRDTNSSRHSEMILDILSDPPKDPLTQLALARRLPELYVRSRLQGTTRRLNLDACCARRIVKTLFALSTEIIDGRECWSIARNLAGPYLEYLDTNDPLAQAFSPETVPSVDRKLFIPGTSTSQATTLTSSELISLLAPELYTTLQTSRVPPLGIPAGSILTSYNTQPQASASASAFGGKVYSLHEFRRERDAGGLGGSGLGVGAWVRPASRHVDDFGGS
ncbi:hypothetical protein BD324DRAFT_630613 [Kockovaella imperatae]|uniref:Uncharacterized protein n=1 Tax=Kockovaella imperatae TaxID=4999 RepID=A0A1Y1UC19_9TREE|nr:hypothetical protein BD324DRAFT_630613 [Kockovaella imperatae]ORX35552.1 hypothetical protein BD324DRAFT_630613 [Kockovaella imperatae]